MMKEKRKPEPGYKPSMIFSSECKYCGTKVTKLGWCDFEDACDEHLKRCSKNPANKR